MSIILVSRKYYCRVRVWPIFTYIISILIPSVCDPISIYWLSLRTIILIIYGRQRWAKLFSRLSAIQVNHFDLIFFFIMCLRRPQAFALCTLYPTYSFLISNCLFIFTLEIMQRDRLSLSANMVNFVGKLNVRLLFCQKKKNVVRFASSAKLFQLFNGYKILGTWRDSTQLDWHLFTIIFCNLRSHCKCLRLYNDMIWTNRQMDTISCSYLYRIGALWFEDDNNDDVVDGDKKKKKKQFSQKKTTKPFCHLSFDSNRLQTQPWMFYDVWSLFSLCDIATTCHCIHTQIDV